MAVMRSLFFLVILTGITFQAFLSETTVYAGADAHAFEILYGEGVNAFNNKDYEKTIRLFDDAESQGNYDPRCYFFRGLAKHRLGRTDDAAKDFEYAASLELSKAGRSYNVPRGLQRIQGKERLMIEQYRRQAKKKWENEQALLKKAEFEVQKQKDRQIYNQLIEKGAKAGVDTNAAVDSQPFIRQIPFGAKPIIPFGVTDIRSTEVPSETPVMTEDNMFKSELEKTVVLPPPQKSHRFLRIQSPSERRRLAAERRAELEGEESGWSDAEEMDPGAFADFFNPFDNNTDGPVLFDEGITEEDADNPFGDDSFANESFGDDSFGDEDVDLSDDDYVDPFVETPATDSEEPDVVIPLPDVSNEENEESDTAEPSDDDLFAEEPVTEKSDDPFAL